MISTPTNTLEVMSGIPPLKFRLEFLQAKYISKCKYKKPGVERSLGNYLMYYGDNRLSEMYIQALRDVMNTTNWYSHDFNTFVAQPVVNFSYKDELCVNKNDCSILVHNAIFRKLTEMMSGFEFIYTDGSKTEITTFAVHHRGCTTETYKLSKGGVFDSEAYAILYALQHIEDTGHLTSRFCIVSDSMSVLKALSTRKHPSGIQHILVAVKSLYHNLSSRGFIIKFLWVPSHIGIEGNESADRATRDTPLSTIVNSEISVVFKQLKTELLEKWQTYWTNSTEKGRYYYDLQPEVKFELCCKAFSSTFSRRDINVLSRILSGHNLAKTHLNRIGVVDSNICDCNTSEATADHLLWDCPQINHQHIIQYFNSQGLTQPFSIKHIFSFPLNLNFIKTVLNFILQNNISL